jgi:hypothetical protein
MNNTKIVYLVISISLAYLLFFIVTPWVFSDLTEYKLMNVSKTFSKQLSIELIKGVCPYGSKGVVNTSLKTKANYVNVPESMNKEGGIEFSYSFWMRLMNSDSSQILFTKGLFQDKSTGFLDAVDGKTAEAVEHTKINSEINGINHEQLVKCPLVKMTSNSLNISFNTLRKIHNEIEYKYDDIIKSSQHNPRWFLFSVVFKEGAFTTDYGLKTKGIIVDLYVNEQHVKSKFIENDSLKLNEGNIHVFPQAIDDTDNMFGDLNYHNFALTVNDVEKIWKKGFNKGGCSISGSTNVNTQMNDLGRNGANLF